MPAPNFESIANACSLGERPWSAHQRVCRPGCRWKRLMNQRTLGGRGTRCFLECCWMQRTPAMRSQCCANMCTSYRAHIQPVRLPEFYRVTLSVACHKFFLRLACIDRWTNLLSRISARLSGIVHSVTIHELALTNWRFTTRTPGLRMNFW